MKYVSRPILSTAVFAFVLGIASPAQIQKNKPEDDLIDRWFAVFSNELNDLSKTDGRWVEKIGKDGKATRTWIEPRFGTSRLATIPGHDLPMDAEYIGNQKHIREELGQRGLLGLVWIYGSGTGALEPKTMKAKMRIDSAAFPDGTISRDQWKKANEAEIEVKALAAEALKQRWATKSIIRTIHGWQMESRVFRISNMKCLKCHKSNKLNDPVAVFVFATREKF